MDNNAISSFFSETLSEKAMDFVAEIINRTPTISVITEIEALSWVNSDKNKEQIVREFVSDATVLPLSPEVITRCIKLRRSRKIKTPDAIIAATALIHNLVLITNDGDFDKIEGLRTINPHTF
jgi:predicted nucleic acid-binding protein